jgi:hypothetical protein
MCDAVFNVYIKGERARLQECVLPLAKVYKKSPNFVLPYNSQNVKVDEVSLFPLWCRYM